MLVLSGSDLQVAIPKTSFPEGLFLRVLAALFMGSLRVFMRILRVRFSFFRMLRSLAVVAFRVMFCGGAMRLGGALMFFGGLRMSFIHE
jgi:hypothetical protein